MIEVPNREVFFASPFLVFKFLKQEVSEMKNLLFCTTLVLIFNSSCQNESEGLLSEPKASQEEIRSEESDHQVEDGDVSQVNFSVTGPKLKNVL